MEFTEYEVVDAVAVLVLKMKKTVKRRGGSPEDEKAVDRFGQCLAWSMIKAKDLEAVCKKLEGE